MDTVSENLKEQGDGEDKRILISPFILIFQVKQEILNRIDENKVFAQNISSDAFLLFWSFSLLKKVKEWINVLV